MSGKKLNFLKAIEKHLRFDLESVFSEFEIISSPETKVTKQFEVLTDCFGLGPERFLDSFTSCIVVEEILGN